MNINKPLEILGHVSWLWASSPLHRNWPVSLFAINVLPAIQANQYALLTRDDYPVAYCSWANLSLENEIKYLNDVTSLVAEDWTSGDRKWFIDWIAPFGDNGALYKYMRKNSLMNYSEPSGWIPKLMLVKYQNFMEVKLINS